MPKIDEALLNKVYRIAYEMFCNDPVPSFLKDRQLFLTYCFTQAVLIVQEMEDERNKER